MAQQTPRFKPVSSIWTVVAMFLLAMLAVNYFFSTKTPAERSYVISYSTFKTLLNDSQVTSVTLRGRDARGELAVPHALGPGGEYSKHFQTHLPELDDDSLLPLLDEKKVDIDVLPADGRTSVLTLLISYLPWLLIIAFWIWIIRRAQRNITGGLGGKGELGKFLRGSAEVAEIPKISFDDVAGQDAAKREVTELVEFLKDPEQYRKLGAEVPRGVLLMGPPGTGKSTGR